MSFNHRALVGACSTLALTAGLLVGGVGPAAATTDPAATAAAGTRPPRPEARAVYDPVVASEATAEEVVYDKKGNVVSDRTYDQSTQGELIPSAAAETQESRTGLSLLRVRSSGSGGRSSAYGCHRVYVHNTYRTLLGFVAFRYHTWTDHCWNRARKRVTNVTTGWYISNVDSAYDWRGIVNRSHGFYGWLSGYRRSGYFHYRMGRFDDCVLKYGCIGSIYPANRLRVHSNGTWWWKTEA